MWIMSFLASSGYLPAYLSRGYGRQTKGFFLLNKGKYAHPTIKNQGDPKSETSIISSKNCGDEAIQVALRFPDLPVAVCENRLKGSGQLLSLSMPDILILDDAFQHRRIRRDLDIVLIDGNSPPHKDSLLPVGNLREPVSSLKRADLVIINKVSKEKAAEIHAIICPDLPFLSTFPQAIQAVSFHREVAPISLENLSQRSVYGFSGLGNNDFFKSQLEKLSGELIGFKAFPDHYNYDAHDLDEILLKFTAILPKNGLPAGEKMILTTEKDFCRIKGNSFFNTLGKIPLFYLQSELEWLAGEEIFKEKITQVLN